MLYRISVIILLFLLLPIISSAAKDIQTSDMVLGLNGVTGSDISRSLAKKEYSLYDVFIIALKKNQDMSMEGERAIQSKERKNQAFGAFLPKLSLKAQKILPDDVSGSQKTGLALYARQNIFTGFSEYAAYKSAAYETEMRKYSILNFSGDLLLKTSTFFYNVILLEKSISNRKDILKLYNGIVGELRRRVYLGKSRRSEVLRTEAQIQNLKAEILSMENELNRTRLSLATLTGIGENAALLEEVKLPDPGDTIEPLLSSLTQRADVKASMQEVLMAEKSLLAARGGHFPSAYLEGSYYLYRKGGGSGDYSATLGAELPIFSGGITSARVRECESKLRESRLGLEKIKTSAEEEIKDSFRSWKSSTLETEAYREAAQRAERNYYSVLSEYRLNLTTILDVFDSLTELGQARDAYEKRRLQLTVDRIRLGVATNEFLGKKSSALKSN